MSAIPEKPAIKMTVTEWQAEANRLFGEPTDWKFVCPGCGHVATPRDFKNIGVDPNKAAQECIGRYTAGSSWLRGPKKQPCDYAAFGLFRIGPTFLVGDDGEEIPVFGFAVQS
jgi:hypothetical protein